MTSSNEFTKKMIEAISAGKDITPIISDYMQELLIDIGSRYTMTEISQPVLAAAFRLQSDIIYSRLDKGRKEIFDMLVSKADGNVQEIRFPCGFKKED